MRAATTPRQGPRGARLLVIEAQGAVSHRAATDLPALLREHDLLVANDAATLPASLSGVHERTGAPVEIRLAGRRSLAGGDTAFTAVVFGAGDYRTATERRLPPPRLQAGDNLVLGPLRARITRTHDHARLVDLRFEHAAAEIWEGLARHGRPIQYAYVREPLAIWDTWTSIASQPAAFEPPSAGFILNWSMLRQLRSRGVRFATVTHAAGISSTGDPELDRQLPFDEPYVVPRETARLIGETRQSGGRVIAVGTTVVRALESAADDEGGVVPGPGTAAGRIGKSTRLRVVDALVSGMHERGTSHYELLGAFQEEEEVLDLMACEAEALDYQGHEFGDAVFIVRAPSAAILHQRSTAA